MTNRRREKLPEPACNFSGRDVVLGCMNTILVTGATGNVGRPLVTQLAAPASRSAPSPDTQTPRLSRRRRGGGPAAESPARRLGGVPQLPRARRRTRPLVQRARREGVTRLVALSAINADDDFSRQPSRFRGDRNKEVEQLAVDSGLEWVSLRPTVFATNFVGMWAPQIQAGDVVNGPYATASTAPIVDRTSPRWPRRRCSPTSSSATRFR